MLLWLSLVTAALSALALASLPQIQPWMNTSLSARQRAEALAAVMTWDEKIGQLGGIRRLLGANVTFDQNSFNQTSKYQNGNIGKTKMLLYPTADMQELCLDRSIRIWGNIQPAGRCAAHCEPCPEHNR